MPCFPLNSGGGVALGLLVLYLAVGFGLRAAILYHRTGSLGLHGVQGAFGSVEWIAGMLFVVGLLAGGAAAIGDMLHLMKRPSARRWRWAIRGASACRAMSIRRW
jgi:hypothetical protein